MEKQIGILFFAQKPDVEAVSKHWTKSQKVNSCLSQSLYKHSLSIVKNSSLPFIIHTEDIQEGSSFAERITHAVSSTFDKTNWDDLIIVGSDTFDLSHHDIINARQIILNGDIAYGKSVDGGLFLIHVNRKAFNQEDFASLPWQTSRLADEFIRYCTLHSLQPRLIGIKKDLDFPIEIFDSFLINLGLYCDQLSDSNYCNIQKHTPIHLSRCNWKAPTRA